MSFAIVLSSALLVATGGATAAQVESAAPGSICANLDAHACLDIALAAMGGRERLAAIKTVRSMNISHTLLPEQSYRQEPFIVAYARDELTMDLTNHRLRDEIAQTWPESDNDQAESKITLIVDHEHGVFHMGDAEIPASPDSLHDARQTLGLGPYRILLNAAQASDLRYLPRATVRGTMHSVLGFSWNKLPVRVLINPYNGLPDAVETVQQFSDMWYFWGDVRERVYFDNWKFYSGLTLPTQMLTERNGMAWSSTQTLSLSINPAVADEKFKLDAKAAAQSSTEARWNSRSLATDKAYELAPGVLFYPGAWNTTIIRQDDGLVILEAPISEHYFAQVVSEAHKKFPDLPIKAVLTTSDSWPHIGGVRYAASQQMPIYALDLNRVLLDRFLAAPHTLAPDTLSAQGPALQSPFNFVSTPTTIGSGDNRVILIPLRGAATERQYAVYFPAHKLLYASDTLALNQDGSIYDPELTIEVVKRVAAEHLQVDKVFAMHQDAIDWKDVLRKLPAA